MDIKITQLKNLNTIIHNGKSIQFRSFNSPAGRTSPVQQGLKLYLSGESLTADKWTDLSGNNYHAVPVPAMDTPVKHEVIYNNKNFSVARFAANSAINLPDKLDIQKPFTIFIADRYYGNTQKRTLESRTPGNNWLLGKWNGKDGSYMGDWTGPYSTAVKDKFALNMVSLENTQPYWYLNGIKKGESQLSAEDPRLLGIGKAGATGNETSEADVACILIYDRVLSENERKHTERWLADRYGIREIPLTLLP